MSERIAWTKSEWEQIYELFSYLSKNCTDIDIFNGKIRSFNDYKNTCFDLDIKKDITVTIPLIKDVLPIFKAFTPESDTDVVYFYIDKNKYIIEDNESSVSNSKADTMICNNPYITDSEFEKYSRYLKVPIGEITFTDKILDRISTMISIFDSLELKLNVKDNVASLTLDSESKSKHSKIVSNLKLDIVDGVYGIPIVLFTTPWKNLTIKLFKKEDGKYIFNSSGDIMGLTVNLYSAVIKKTNDKFSN